jgi:hypothetical protein
MQNKEAGGRFKRLAARLKGLKTPSPTAASPQDNQTSQEVSTSYNDRQRAQTRYKEAASKLREAIKTCKGSCGSFDFGDFDDESEAFDDSEFKNKINSILTLRETLIKDRKGWSTLTYAVECVFTAFSPFAKNFLTVAKNIQSVMPFNQV